MVVDLVIVYTSSSVCDLESRSHSDDACSMVAHDSKNISSSNLGLFKVGGCLARRVEEGRLSTSTSLKWTVVLGGDHDPSIGIALSVRVLTHQELPPSVRVTHHAENFLGCCLDVCVAGSNDSARIKPVVLIGSN